MNSKTRNSTCDKDAKLARERTLIFDENWRMLATAIVSQAGTELRECNRNIRKLSKELETEENLDKRACRLFKIKKHEDQIASLRKFFNSEWFDALTYLATAGEIEHVDFKTIEHHMQKMEAKRGLKNKADDPTKPKRPYHKKSDKKGASLKKGEENNVC